MADEATLNEIFQYGPLPNEDGEIDLSNYARDHIANYQNVTELPEENKKYLDEVLTTGKYKVVNMYKMFNGCESLTSLDVSNWNTSNVTNMNNMFDFCTSLTSLDVSNFDTSNVTDMGGMFAACESLTSLDLSNFDTSNVTNMNYMFTGCNSLTSLDVSNWDTSNVTDMHNMFTDCNSLTSLDVSNFDTSNVTDMDGMFAGCHSLTTVTGTIDMNKVSTYPGMLFRTPKLQSISIKLPSTISKEDFLTNSRVDTSVTTVNFVEEIIMPTLKGVFDGNYTFSATAASIIQQALKLNISGFSIDRKPYTYPGGTIGTSTSNSVTVTVKKSSDGSSIVFYYDFSSNSWKQSGSTQLMVAPGDSIGLAFARTTPFNNAYNGTTTYSTTAIVQSNFSASLNLSSCAATLKTFMFTITPGDHQTITVKNTSTDGTKSYTSNFTAYYGDTWTASIAADANYKPGTLSAASGTISAAYALTATAAQANTRTVTIAPTQNQTIKVTFSNGKVYTSKTDQEVVCEEPYGVTFTVSVEADPGYIAGAVHVKEAS